MGGGGVDPLCSPVDQTQAQGGGGGGRPTLPPCSPDAARGWIPGGGGHFAPPVGHTQTYAQEPIIILYFIKDLKMFLFQLSFIIEGQ